MVIAFDSADTEHSNHCRKFYQTALVVIKKCQVFPLEIFSLVFFFFYPPLSCGEKPEERGRELMTAGFGVCVLSTGVRGSRQ